MRIRELTMGLCVLVMSQTTPLKSYQRDHSNVNWTRTRTTGTGKVDRGKSKRPQPHTRNYRQLRKAESRRKSFPGKIIPIGYPIPNN